MPFRYFDDPFVYGPLTQEEFDAVPINHRATFVNGQIYIGVSRELEEFADRKIDRPAPPVVIEEPTEE
jgi:hypothetical protein